MRGKRRRWSGHDFWQLGPVSVFSRRGAMGCQKSITQQIVSRDADYVLAVKRNQGRLYEDLRTLQRRVKGWRSVMARRLVYASSDERAVEQRYRGESALVGTGISG